MIFLSLSTGALFAGARCAVSTLWPASGLLMRRFSELHFGDSKLPPAAALREATHWLRQDFTSGEQLKNEIMPEFLASMPDGPVKNECRKRAAAHAEDHPDTPPFAEPQHWAAVTANGAAFGI